MKPSRVVIKLGGASLQDPSVLKTFTDALKQYKKFGYQVILVHGGGPAINQELTRLQIPWSFFQGQRITTADMIGPIENVLCNQVNKQLVNFFNEQDLPAQSVSGAEGLLECSQVSEHLGQVGWIESVNSEILEDILGQKNSPIPVIATIGIGAKNQKYNINADWAASKIATALKAEYLIFLTDQKGILNANKGLIPEMDISGLYSLIEDEIVQGGMLTKTKTILAALENGVKAVRVMNGLESVNGLWSNHVGTWCFPQTPAPMAENSLPELRYVFS